MEGVFGLKPPHDHSMSLPVDFIFLMDVKKWLNCLNFMAKMTVRLFTGK